MQYIECCYPPEMKKSQIRITFTQPEYKRVQRTAKDAKCSIHEVIRAVLKKTLK